MSEIAIMSGVPVPNVQGRGRPKTENPYLKTLVDMVLGDCFVVNGKTEVAKVRAAIKEMKTRRWIACSWTVRNIAGLSLLSGQEPCAPGTFGVWCVEQEF